jgi:hypothetical protein
MNSIELYQLASVLEGYAEIAQSRWAAWVRKLPSASPAMIGSAADH